jgi:hypothetical protein
MNQLTSLITDFLNGKSLFSPLTRTFNVLMSASITSWLFTRIYFPYSIIPFSDYRAIIHFFLNGDFFPPLMIFLIVHYSLGIIAETIFSLTILHYSSKWINKIIKYKTKIKDFDSTLKRIDEIPIMTMPVKINKPIFLKYFEYIKNSIKPEDLAKAKIALEKNKRNVNSNFKLAFKSIFLVTIYFISIRYFGCLLYGLSITVLIALLLFFLIFYLIMEVAPTLISKMNQESEQYSKLAESAPR